MRTRHEMLMFAIIYNTIVGHCAQYGTYVVMDWQSGYVIACELVDRRETRCNSKALEMCGFLRCLYKLLDVNLEICTFVTDGHLDIKKFFRKFHLHTMVALSAAIKMSSSIFRNAARRAGQYGGCSR